MRRKFLTLMAAMIAAAPAQAADRVVELRAPAPVAPGVAAMPQIVGPADAAERRINAALRALDGAVRQAAKACLEEEQANAGWERAVDAPMRGPGFLSVRVTDDVYCASAYPNHTVAATTYDLRTGLPVDWTKLLPPRLTGHVALAQQADGTRMVTLASGPLLAAYLAAYRPPGNADAAECNRMVTGLTGEQTPMMPWLDPGRGGLVLQFELPHAFQVCATQSVVPVAVLRQAGASRRLLDAVGRARAGR